MSYTNVHKANIGSQLNIFYKSSFTRVHPHLNEFTHVPLKDLPE